MRARPRLILTMAAIVLLGALSTGIIIAWQNRNNFQIPRWWTRYTAMTGGSYRVRDVRDGDTIVIDMAGVTETIRLIGIDTPETHRPNTPRQCFGQEAATRLTDLVEGRTVTLSTDPLSDNRDRYGRLLRYVNSEGRDLNALMIQEGYAFAYTPFLFSRRELYTALETEAKTQNRGLWQACTATIIRGVWQTNPSE